MKNSEQSIGLTANHGLEKMALQSVHAHGEVDGLLLRMALRQVYRNTTDKELETVYSFPLAWGTTLLGMRVELNGKVLHGSVIEKSDAEERYEQAIEKGDLPVMLVREGKDLYSARIGNLKPGDETVIEIDYGQLLTPDQGYTRITIPTTIAPRYGRDPGLRGMVAHAIGTIDPFAEYRFFLTLALRGPLARGRIACPSHTVSQQAGDQGLTVQLSQQAMLDRDFILTIETDDIGSALVSPNPGETDAYTVLQSFAPRLPAATKTEAPLQLKILIDCSGSMAGDSLRMAKQALASVIGRLRAVDYVSFSRFGSSTMHVVDRLVPASEAHLPWLLDAVQKTEADMGGTALEMALRQVIALRQQNGKEAEAASILLITDGEVWDIDAIVATVRQSGHQVYVIGVGSSPAESLVRELAEVSGGAAELASGEQNMAAATARLVEKMRSTLDLEVAAVLDGESLLLPRKRYRVAAGTTLHLWYPLNRRLAQSAQITVTDRRSGEQQTIASSALAWNSDGTVARIGAAQCLHDITDARERRKIALQYQLITEQTHFLLVHERDAADKASGMPALQPIGSMLAAGWGGAGTVMECGPAKYELPSFMRRQADVPDPTSSAAQTPRFSMRSLARGITRFSDWNPALLWYTSLGEVIAHPKDSTNPLRQLADKLGEMHADPDAFAALNKLVDGDPRMGFLRPLLDALEKLSGDREHAIALLLSWARMQKPACVRLSRHARKRLDDCIATLPKARSEQASNYLDAAAMSAVGQAGEARTEGASAPG